jgi:3-hydroxy acid dehydrogenase/malonic semialdehyde reductase
MKKTILITGASSGFGRAAAAKFSEAGCKLILVARRLERLQDFYDKFRDKCEILIHKLDVRDLKGIESFINDIPENFKEIDVLINNAGLALGLGMAHQTNLDQWETMIDTNIKGLIYFTRLILPGMVERNRGHIINIGSVAGSYPYPGGNVYGATKAFVNHFSLNLRADLSGTKVRVTSIEPGLCETEFSIVRFEGDIERAKNVYTGTKPLTDQDIADIIYYTATLPEHININRIEVMPVCQSFNPFKIYKSSEE